MLRFWLLQQLLRYPKKTTYKLVELYQIEKQGWGKAKQATCNYCNLMFVFFSSQGTSILWKYFAMVEPMVEQ